MHSALWVADYIIGTGGGILTPIHVLKMTYMVHGYTLAITNKSLISDRVEAWKYGPVIPVVYDAFSQYGSGTIDSLHYCGTELSFDEEVKKRIKHLGERFSKEEREIVDGVVDAYKSWTAGQLITLMHKKDTPWSRHYVEGHTGVVIPDDSTKAYYKRLVYERRQ